MQMLTSLAVAGERIDQGAYLCQLHQYEGCPGSSNGIGDGNVPSDLFAKCVGRSTKKPGRNQHASRDAGADRGSPSRKEKASSVGTKPFLPPRSAFTRRRASDARVP